MTKCGTAIPLVCPCKGSIEYEPGEIECGLLQVPENREKPDSRYIDLHFVKLNSTWDDEEEMDEDEYDASIEPGKRAALIAVPLETGDDDPLRTLCSLPAEVRRLA